jgi:hypothetical protein
LCAMLLEHVEPRSECGATTVGSRRLSLDVTEAGTLLTVAACPLSWLGVADLTPYKRRRALRRGYRARWRLRSCRPRPRPRNTRSRCRRSSKSRRCRSGSGNKRRTSQYKP